MAMNVGGGGGVAANINMTPMIDILLVLLIIFMAISPVHPKGLEALAPQPPPPNTPPPPDNDRTVVIQIAKDQIGQDQPRRKHVGRVLRSGLWTFSRRGTTVSYFIKGDPDLDFSVVARAVDAAHGANIDKVGLMTPKVEEGK